MALDKFSKRRAEVSSHTMPDGTLSDHELIELTKHPKIVALGEAGLDYFYEHGSPEAQERGFRAHIAAARATGPVMESTICSSGPSHGMPEPDACAGPINAHSTITQAPLRARVCRMK